LAATVSLSCGRVAVDATEDTLLEEAAELLDEDELDLLLEDEAAELDETELAWDDELDELAVTSGPTEHQALLVKLLAGNSVVRQVKLPVSVAYTKEPDFPRATEWVPVMLQVLPTCAHFV